MNDLCAETDLYGSAFAFNGGITMNELRELLLSGNVGDYVNALIDLYLNLKMK